MPAHQYIIGCVHRIGSRRLSPRKADRQFEKQKRKHHPTHRSLLRLKTCQLFLSCAPAVQIPAVECSRANHFLFIRPRSPCQMRTLSAHFNLLLIHAHSANSPNAISSLHNSYVIDRLLADAYSRFRFAKKNQPARSRSTEKLFLTTLWITVPATEIKTKSPPPGMEFYE